jgi:hypothetical protein
MLACAGHGTFPLISSLQKVINSIRRQANLLGEEDDTACACNRLQEGRTMDIPKRKPRYASISSDFMIFHHYDERISKAGPHRHDFHEIFLLLSGEISYVVDDRK